MFTLKHQHKFKCVIFFRPFQLNHQWKNECKSSVKNAMKLIETLNGRNSRLKNLQKRQKCKLNFKFVQNVVLFDKTF